MKKTNFIPIFILLVLLQSCGNTYDYIYIEFQLVEGLNEAKRSSPPVDINNLNHDIPVMYRVDRQRYVIIITTNTDYLPSTDFRLISNDVANKLKLRLANKSIVNVVNVKAREASESNLKLEFQLASLPKELDVLQSVTFEIVDDMDSVVGTENFQFQFIGEGIYTIYNSI